MSRKNLGFITCLLISIVFLSVFYRDAFFSPNKYFYSVDGDGLKNYYNYVWLVKNEKSNFEHSGIGYPYGENIFFEDCMPLLSKSVSILTNFFPFLNNYTIGILNFLMLISLAVGALFFYLIFCKFNLPPILAAVSSNGVCILSSQFLLLNPYGHWGLSFICFFPIGWYFLLKYNEEKNKLKWSILIGSNILFWSYIHVYLGFILLLFTLLINVYNALLAFKSYFKKIVSYTSFIFQILLPAITILGIVKITDTHLDRIETQFQGGYAASFYTTFLPLISPFKNLYSKIFDLTPQQNLLWARELGNYIGITSNMGIIIFLIFVIMSIFKKNQIKISEIIPKIFYPYLVAGIALLLFSMAIPIKYFPKPLLNSFPLINQFSALGRFSWAFYYVISVFSITFFYQILYKRKGGKIILYFLIFLFYVEGSSYHLKLHNGMVKHTNAFNKNYIESDKKILTELEIKNFQAILPLPTFFLFNLPFGFSSHPDSSIYNSMIASYHSKLPIISTYLSRPSVSESMLIYKQLLPFPFRKNIEKIVSDKRNIAVLLQNSDTVYLSENERRIISISTIFKQTDKYRIYNLSVDSLLSQNSYNTQKSHYYRNVKPYHKYKNGLWLNDTNQFVVSLDFDSIKSPIKYKGNGAFKGLKLDYSIIYSSSKNLMDTSTQYEVSFAYYNKIWDQTFNTFLIEEKDANGKVVQYLYFSPLDNTLIDGWWYLYKQKFKIKSKDGTISYFFHGNDFYENWFVIDDFLIRPSNVDIYTEENINGIENVRKNNVKYIVPNKTL